MMKPQDIVVLAKLLSYQKRKKNWTQVSLAKELYLSPSQVNYALKRLLESKLIVHGLNKDNDNEMKLIPITRSCEEFLIHGFKFVFPPEFGSQSPGIPTAYAAPPLNEIIVSGSELPPVWPAIGEGAVRGIELKPLYHCVPKSIIKFPDQYFYELLALLDALRSGRARERNIGAEKISEMLKL
jgi:hypothetical protein